MQQFWDIWLKKHFASNDSNAKLIFSRTRKSQKYGLYVKWERNAYNSGLFKGQFLTMYFLLVLSMDSEFN